jgi:O-antigen/teichoic acid export membrane protein
MAAVSLIDSYLIQRLYGSSEQAYFALSMRWSSIVLIFTSSVLMIYWREIAKRIASGERHRASIMYLSFDKMLFFLSLTFAFWLSITGKALIPLVAGKVYTEAVPVMAIMAFYPVQQNLGQLNGVAFLASERTVQYRNTAILTSVPSMMATYFLLASPASLLPGLGLGAIGLALKMVIVGLCTVQVYIWSNCKFFGISYWNLLRDKAITTIVIGSAAAVTLWVFGELLKRVLGFGMLTAYAVASATYFGLTGLMLFLRPKLAGLTRDEILSGIGLIRRWAGIVG